MNEARTFAIREEPVQSYLNVGLHSQDSEGEIVITSIYPVPKDWPQGLGQHQHYMSLDDAARLASAIESMIIDFKAGKLR